ncbi:TolC family protein [Paraburkholderia unamae]|uniref:TolC family protein n=1 Tax=Paraburkholderia unamae TaxID=219649 RepID=A0ACC6RRV8_9BURK
MIVLLPNRKKIYLALLATCLGALIGCTLEAPPRVRDLAAQAAPALSSHRQWANGSTPGDPSDGWLASFDDAQLNQLAREAIAHNGDLALAAIHVQQAEALVTMQSSGLLPAAGARGRLGESESQVVSIGASWELDLWGRIRAQSRAAKSEYAATEADYLWAQRVVAATTAKGWFSLIKCAQIEVELKQIVELQAQLVDIESHRVATGAAPQTELQEARNALRVNRDAVIKATQAKVRAAQALELLLGRYPAGEIEAGPNMPALPAVPPAGLPAHLVERRPDLIAASHRVAEAFDQRQSAHAARLPSVSIDVAITGIRSNVLSLMDSSSPVKGASASFLAPIFTGGKLKAQADYYTEAQKAAVVAYDNSALQALTEVEAGLQAETTYRGRVAELQARVEECRKLLVREEARVAIGSTDERDALKSRQTLLLSEMDLIRARGEQLNERVDLLLALGGDWREASEATAKTGDFVYPHFPVANMKARPQNSPSLEADAVQ